MSDYRRLAAVQVTAVLDTTGKNPGNWTNAFTAQLLPNVNAYEIYHMVITGGPPLAFANIVIAGKPWSWVQLGVNGGNEWDPSQPAKMGADFELYFFWQIAATGPAPVVTAWPQYDRELPENASAGR